MYTKNETSSRRHRLRANQAAKKVTETTLLMRQMPAGTKLLTWLIPQKQSDTEQDNSAPARTGRRWKTRLTPAPEKTASNTTSARMWMVENQRLKPERFGLVSDSASEALMSFVLGDRGLIPTAPPEEPQMPVITPEAIKDNHYPEITH